MNMIVKAIDTVYNGHKFRSRLEARWAVFLDSSGCAYQYEPEGYELPDGCRYLPDFYLPEYNTFLEIKPLNSESEFDEGYDGWDKLKLLSESTGKTGLLFAGSPWDCQFLTTEDLIVNNDAVFNVKFYVDLTDQNIINGFDEWPICSRNLFPQPIMALKCPSCGYDYVHVKDEMVKISYGSVIIPMYCEEDCHWNLYVDNHKGLGYMRVADAYRVRYNPLLKIAGNHQRLDESLQNAKQARFEFGQTPKIGGRI